MDIVARCVNSALWLSGDLRRDCVFYAVLDGPPSPPVCLKFTGETLASLSPDERNIASWISKSLEQSFGEEWAKVQSGISICRKGLQGVAKELKGNAFYALHEKGKDIREAKIKKDPLFFLGDHLGIPLKDEKFLIRLGAEKVSLGPRSYLGSHCIAIVNNELDRRGL